MKKLLAKLIPKTYGMFLNVYALLNKEKAAEKAFYIFCKVRKGKVLPHQKNYLDDAKDQQLQIVAHTIQTYRWVGTKDTVVLVHGWESNTWRWHKLIEKLQEAQYNIIAFDAPGHGYSSGKYLYVPLYSQILEGIKKQYAPKHIIGHSVGGMSVLYNEHEHPDPLVEKLVTIGSPSEFHEIISHFKQLLGFNNRVASALAVYVEKRFGFSEKAFSSTKFVQTNTKKGLLFHDRLDTIAPYHASEQVHAAWENSTLVSTEGLGHSMHQEEINDKIVAFLST